MQESPLLNTIQSLDKLDMGNVTEMENMFSHLSTWNV